MYAAFAAFQGRVGDGSRQENGVAGGDGAAIRRGHNGICTQCLRAGVEGAFEVIEDDAAFAFSIGVGVGDFLFTTCYGGIKVADLPARPVRMGFAKVASNDAPLAVAEQAARRGAVEPVGFELNVGTVGIGFYTQAAFDLPGNDAVHGVAFINDGRAAFTETEADVPIALPGVGGDIRAVAIGTAGIRFK